MNLPLAGTFQQEVFYTRKLKHSLKKRLDLRRAVMQKGRKIGRRPRGTIKVRKPEHDERAVTEGTMALTGEQTQFFLSHQSRDKASTPLQPGEANLELNLGTWAL